MEFIPFQKWFENLKNKEKLLIAGPCSAESEFQVLETARQIAEKTPVSIYRSGIWKPRTTPNSFEGVGEIGLDWIAEVKQKTGLLTTVEVATPEHVEKVLKHPNPPDILWIGSRTTANPFSVQDIADALAGTDFPVMIKNPVIPQIKLWIGAFERFQKKGLKKLAAIHRGFYPFEDTKYRNIPKWELLIDFKTLMPNLQIIGDPSHIAGKRNLLQEVIFMFSCLNVDGLMIETHIKPKEAKSDADQQVTPDRLSELLKNFESSKNDIENEKIKTQLNKLRFSIDSIDYQLLELLAKRMEIVKEIARIKKQNKISIFQIERWKEIIKTRLDYGIDLGLDNKLIKKVIRMLHQESINLQSKLLKEEE